MDFRWAEAGEDRGDLGMVGKNVERWMGAEVDLKWHGKRTQNNGHEE